MGSTQESLGSIADLCADTVSQLLPTDASPVARNRGLMTGGEDCSLCERSQHRHTAPVLVLTEYESQCQVHLDPDKSNKAHLQSFLAAQVSAPACTTDLGLYEG